jgi:uncharacterized protein involved in propanediol utilization
MKTGVGQANYTFGELLQGQINGRPFLVSLPIQHFARAIFYPSREKSVVLSPEKGKVKKVIDQLRKVYHIRQGGTFHFADSLPEGKGFATSTADMLAAVRAFCVSFGLELSLEEIALLLASIEPTDSIMYDGLVAFYHREGVLRERLGYLPPLWIIGIDRGGIVDTLYYNEKIIPYGNEEEMEFAQLLQDLKDALEKGDSREIGRIATRSGEIQQKRMPHPYFSLLQQIRKEEGGVGTVVAHSGTLGGILLDERDPFFLEQRKRIEDRLKVLGLPMYQFSVGGRKEEEQQCQYNPFARVEPNIVL